MRMNRHITVVRAHVTGLIAGEATPAEPVLDPRLTDRRLKLRGVTPHLDQGYAVNCEFTPPATCAAVFVVQAPWL